MHELEYLGDAAVTQYIAFLRDLTLDGCPGVALKVGAGNDRRAVRTLIEAADAYRWRGESLVAVNSKMEALRHEMQAALAQCAAAEGRSERRLAELELLFVSTKTLSWGRVYEGAFPFLIHQAETGVLSENLRRAAALIDGEIEEVGAFDDSPYRSDCGMTKVYAAINRRSVVYDDRLGAALALLCRRCLEVHARPVLPELLTFMVGEETDPRRNPSGAGVTFPEKRSGREHARWNMRATWIVSALAADERVAALLGGHHRERVRRIEAGLFMVGEDVQDQPRTVGSPARAPRRVSEPASAAEGGGQAS